MKDGEKECSLLSNFHDLSGQGSHSLISPLRYTGYLIFIQLRRRDSFQKEGLEIQKCLVTSTRSSLSYMNFCLEYYEITFFNSRIMNRAFAHPLKIWFQKGANYQMSAPWLEDFVWWISVLAAFRKFKSLLPMKMPKLLLKLFNVVSLQQLHKIKLLRGLNQENS